MNLTFAECEAGYHAMWAKCAIAPKCAAEVQAVVARILAHKADYIAVEEATDVPWFMVAALHSRESNLDFSTYLGNGDPLNRVTTDVPRGRGPFPTWMAGAEDALAYQGFTKIKAWPIEQILFSAEEFNGEGYELHHENSPYIWAATNLQQDGKYKADGVYSSTEWDTQLGVAAIIEGLLAVDADVQAALLPKDGAPAAPAPGDA